MEKILSQKKILFICPDHYDFPDLMASRMTDFGADVQTFIDTGGQFYYRFSKYLGLQEWLNRLARKKLLRLCVDSKFDYLFVIKGNVLDNDTISRIKKLNKGILSIMYQWDSIYNFDFSDLIPCFDKMYSFDYSDCEKFKELLFLPLFYIDLVPDLEMNSKRDVDLLAYGVYFPERYRIIREMQEIANEHKLNSHLKLYIPFIDFLKMIFKERKFTLKNLSLFPAGRKEINSLLKRSKCVLDVHHPKQTGLTSRTIEALGAKCKLLTTNRNIAKEKFYNENVIQIMNNEDLSKHVDFIRADYEPIPFNSYSLSSFLIRVFR